MNLPSGARAWTALLVALAVLAVAAGCGSDDGGDDGGAGARSPADAAGASTAASDGATGADEAEIRDLFARMAKAIAARDAAQACSMMTRSARRTFVMLAESGPRTCERGFALAFKEGVSEDTDPKLVKVEVAGPRATVYARTTTSRKPERAPFVKEGAQWKVESWLTD